ncbi:tetratricopeptide repeat protein [Planktothrix mougeotii]|uniref:Tetratricopeptide repeat protein n=1 Tax=Planktothrix mougeotii LEGE 06226 TaxID=1828728 RepID=A0ABR9UBX7_9CYAN|nr:tetratricopeptide repeat protein [Planktothrix mougeotii]MBE9143963.1 tetratricopeptide repeat protein [Planktothrix mougeotii LEGE 06226]
MDKAEFLTIFPTFERLEVVQKTLPSIIAETKRNNARLIVHDSSVDGQAEKWAYLQELNQNNDFFLILSDNLSMAHARNMCLSLGQELYGPDYICMIEDDHGYNSGFIVSVIEAMKQYYGKSSPVGDLKYGLFTGCRVHNRHLTQKLPDGNAYVDPNSPPEQMGRANSCCRCAPTSHWNNVLKGLDTDEYLISYYQTKHLNLRNYHKGFTTLLVANGEKMFEIESAGRGDSIKSKIRMWDDNYAASDPRSVFLGKPDPYKSEPWKRINSRIKLEISSDNSEEYRRLGDSLFKESKFDEAAAYYQRAIALDDKSVWAYFGLGKSWQRSGRLLDAIATYKKAIECDSSKADIYHWLGEALVLAGEAKEAIIAYQKAIELKPNLAYPYRGLGGAMMEMGDLEGAITLLRKSTEINPKYLAAYNQLGEVLAAQGNFSEAATCYQKAIELNPKSFLPFGQLAEIFAEQGKIEEALNYFQQAIQLNPKHQAVHTELIAALSK